ncbi:thioredoxin family protein [Roseibacillus ishigakijimensis]|uniref:Thioredoxin family protein n=1 Tax=Roseibacillus ishigakijimensis TaxID=454146 RepID=A0A934VLB3_9BACT|nr:thioredoxin family protein [Roseibacillus ishigakijimensis]MBK1832936.1 thioredoxin family protein [Roseibacillus ishigakijimensis]
MRLFIPLLAGALFAVSSSLPANEAVWLDHYEAGLEKAAAEDKDLLITFVGSDWCDQCQVLRESVLTKNEFTRALGRDFVFVELDFPQSKPAIAERNEPIRVQYGIKGYPVLVTADENGHPYGVVRYLHDWRVTDYVDAVKDQQDNRLTRDEARQEFEAAQSDEDRVTALEKLLRAVPETSILGMYEAEFQALREASKDQSPLVAEVVAKERTENLQTELVPLMNSKRYQEAVALCDDYLSHETLKKGERQMALAFKYYSLMEIPDYQEAMETAQTLQEIDPASPIGQQAFGLVKRAEKLLLAAREKEATPASTPDEPAVAGVGEAARSDGQEAEVAKTEGVAPAPAKSEQEPSQKVDTQEASAKALAAVEAALKEAEAALKTAREAHEESLAEQQAPQKEEGGESTWDESQVSAFEKRARELTRQAEALRQQAEKLRKASQQ